MISGVQESIDARDVITVVAVSDLSRSKDWYSRVFGKGPDLEPFPGHLEYKIGGAWVHISKGEVKPSGWRIEIEVQDLQRGPSRLQKAGISTSEIGTSPGAITWFSLKDPDGNAMRWFRLLTMDAQVTGNRD